RYLKDSGLIDTFSIPYTARINGAGVDAIKGAQRRPDQPSANFPSVSYNIVNNTMNVGTMSNSPVQQGGCATSTLKSVMTKLLAIVSLVLAFAVSTRPRSC